MTGTAFLIKFGEGLGASTSDRNFDSLPHCVSVRFRGDPRQANVRVCICYRSRFGGLIPLSVYFFIRQIFKALIYSYVVTGTVLLVFGVVKARVTSAATAEGGICSYVRSAFSSLMVGGAASGAAYGIVAALEG